MRSPTTTLSIRIRRGLPMVPLSTYPFRGGSSPVLTRNLFLFDVPAATITYLVKRQIAQRLGVLGVRGGGDNECCNPSDFCPQVGL
jgi:hypothetical protein